MTPKRIAAANSLVKKNKLDAFIVSKLNNVRYLSGYSGSNGLLILAPPKVYFLTDFRYTVQARKEVKNCQVIIAERDLLGELVHLPCFKTGARVGFEPGNVTVKILEKIRELLPNVTLVPVERIVESLSVVKDNSEINKIKKACKITDQALADILKLIKPGVKEKDIALDLSYRMIKLGAEGPSFDFIVASGQRSSMPHGRASDRRFKKGDFITLDIGCFSDGYASDLTRTYVLGKATPKQKKIYNIVFEAQEAAIAAAKPDLPAKELDMIAREIINKAGYGDNFGHGLGHGIGLLVHDEPTVSPRSTDILAVGNVITVEPGIYIPNWGGVRIEDDVLIVNGGCKVLTKSPKELIEL
jgi:Xaa-Pro aminopeptidase